jgi:hypothetical protein
VGCVVQVEKEEQKAKRKAEEEHKKMRRIMAKWAGLGESENKGRFGWVCSFRRFGKSVVVWLSFFDFLILVRQQPLIYLVVGVVVTLVVPLGAGLVKKTAR